MNLKNVLKKHCHSRLDLESMLENAKFCRSNKGAMFGLDARIALAIFGALSVISGAALYGAIQKSHATALLADLNEIAKAWESYYLDTGQLPPVLTTAASDWTDHTYDGSELISSTVKGWKGPYLPYKTTGTTLHHSKYQDIYITEISDSGGWGDTVNWYPAGLCDGSNICYAWAHISGVESETLMKAVDDIVDNGDGAKDGNFRWRYVSASSKWGTYFKIAPVKK
ncbi:MAG TPA: hypothetical protein DCL21_00710 [Alphaproteobacteria bacterium]|nr:hypothetical protein [Alphaproteobacteria bacterium]